MFVKVKIKLKIQIGNSINLKKNSRQKIITKFYWNIHVRYNMLCMWGTLYCSNRGYPLTRTTHSWNKILVQGYLWTPLWTVPKTFPRTLQYVLHVLINFIKQQQKKNVKQKKKISFHHINQNCMDYNYEYLNIYFFLFFPYYY